MRWELIKIKIKGGKIMQKETLYSSGANFNYISTTTAGYLLTRTAVFNLAFVPIAAQEVSV